MVSATYYLYKSFICIKVYICVLLLQYLMLVIFEMDFSILVW